MIFLVDNVKILIMKFKELKRSLIDGVERIYLVTGDDAFFVAHSVKLICDKCLSQPELNLTNFDGQDVKGNPDKLISALVSYPFMSEKRVVIVKEYYPLAADVKVLSDYFANPCETTVLIVCDSAPADNLAKQKNVTTVDCSKGDKLLLTAWINNRVKTDNCKITSLATEKLIEYCDGDLTRINGETEKLVSYCAGGEITDTDVDALCVKETDYKLYEVVDFIASKRYDKAYETFTEMAESAGDGQKLFVSLYYHFRKLLFVSLSAESDGALASYLGIKEYAVKKAREQARRFSAKRLKSVMDKLSEEDSLFKQGRIEANSAVWNGILNVLVG